MIYQKGVTGKQLTKAEEMKLHAKHVAGTEAEKREVEKILIESCLKYAIQKANKRSYFGVLAEDLYQEACLGLVKAVQTFDFTRGHRFITHAHYQMDAAITEAIQKHGSLIRLPVSIQHKINAEKAESESSESETESTIAKTISFNRMISEEDEMVAVLENKNAELPDSQFEGFATTQASIRNFLSRMLTERELKVVKATFGFDQPAQTLQEVAEDMSISAERVRQIQRGALNKLKTKSDVLLSFF